MELDADVDFDANVNVEVGCPVEGTSQNIEMQSQGHIGGTEAYDPSGL